MTKRMVTCAAVCLVAVVVGPGSAECYAAKVISYTADGRIRAE